MACEDGESRQPGSLHPAMKDIAGWHFCEPAMLLDKK